MVRNPIAEHAARLERESGKALADFPYADADYARRKTIPPGLDQLRAVQDEGMLRTLWALFWLCEASSGAHPAAAPKEPDEWDGFWDPGQQAQEEDLFARRHALTREGVEGILRAEWEGFERKMGVASGERFAQSGSFMSDAQKAQHRRKFHSILKLRYGRSEVVGRAPVE